MRDAKKPRDWALPAGCSITEESDDVLKDDDIDIVVEVMGGTTLAKDVVMGALKARKDVVTANKALIADCLPELDAVVADLNSGDEPPVQFGYEATRRRSSSGFFARRRGRRPRSAAASPSSTR